MDPDPLITALRDRRVLLEISVEEVARLLRCSPGMVRKWESGHAAPSVHRLREWAELLGMVLHATVGADEIAAVGKADIVHPDGQHEYWSTHCRCSEDHDACSATTVNGGPRTPARSKCCDSPCICPCHDQVPGSTEQEN